MHRSRAPRPARSRVLRPAGSPNQYASDWTLLRHVTVLSGPVQAAMCEGTPNSPRQLPGQSLPGRVAPRGVEHLPHRQRDRGTRSVPRVIRPTAENPPIFANALSTSPPPTWLKSAAPSRRDARPVAFRVRRPAATTHAHQDQSEDSSLVGATIAARQPSLGAPDQPRHALVPNMASPAPHAGVDDRTLPADSDYQSSMERARIHCEPKAPDALGAGRFPGSVGRVPRRPVLAADGWGRCSRRGTSSPTAPSSSSGWSFGRVYPPNYSDNAKRGKVIWRRMTRTVDGVRVASPYPDSSRRLDRGPERRAHCGRTARSVGTAGLLGYLVPGEIIHYLPPAWTEPQHHALPPCFGYIDPCSSSRAAMRRRSRSPGAWPKLLPRHDAPRRPQSPGVEETFGVRIRTSNSPVGTQN